MTTLAPLPATPPATLIRDAALEPIAAKVEAGERLSIADGELLFSTPDIWTVCALADQVRRRLHGDAAYYNINRHLNYSNICALSCKFCEFYRKRGDEGAYERSIEEVRAEARRAIEAGATEMHIVGGLHPYLPFEYYTDLVRAIREEADAHCGAGFQPARATETVQAGSPHHNEPGRLHIKAFTAVEIVHLAKIAKVYKQHDRTAGIRWVLERLKAAGLGSLPGGGAEVFDDRVHDEAFKGKIRSDVWLDVHRVAHELGLNTNATILYGHIEDKRERLVHMDMLRRAQDVALGRMGYESMEGTEARGHEGTEGIGPITLTRPGTPLPHPDLTLRASVPSSLRPSPCGYFQTITPLPFIPDGSDLEALPGPGGLENLRTLAIARLMLDNFPHVKAFWIMQTLGMAQLMLQNGADDIDGTVVWYDITKVEGSGTHQETTAADLRHAIVEAGFEPVERDTLYRRVERDGKPWWLAE
ncbi:MAG: radical SAM protein [Phycisphaerales bacterium]|nr:radical SAM protein [Phycisphaerales bacterium]